MAYSPWAGCWHVANIYGPGCQDFDDNTFIIYRPFHTHDDDCPGLPTLVRKLHYAIAANHPDDPLLRIPRRYRQKLEESSDEMDEDDNES